MSSAIGPERVLVSSKDYLKEVGFKIADLSEIVDAQDLSKRIEAIYQANQIEALCVVATKKTHRK